MNRYLTLVSDLWKLRNDPEGFGLVARITARVADTKPRDVAGVAPTAARTGPSRHVTVRRHDGKPNDECSAAIADGATLAANAELHAMRALVHIVEAERGEERDWHMARARRHAAQAAANADAAVAELASADVEEVRR